METPEKNNQQKQQLRIENRRRLVATGVVDVGTVSAENVTAATRLGELHIRGKNLKVVHLDAGAGELVLSGEIAALSYADEQPGRSLLARIFK